MKKIIDKDYPKVNKVEVFDYSKGTTRKVRTFTVTKRNTNVRTILLNEEGILRVFVTPKHLKNPKCSCGKSATTQTANGKYQESIGALPQNFGWYCDKCYAEGLKMEMEEINANA